MDTSLGPRSNTAKAPHRKAATTRDPCLCEGGSAIDRPHMAEHGKPYI